MAKKDDSDKGTLFCSFCGKSQHEVRKLIAGPTVFICDECVELCMDIIREEHKTQLSKSHDGVPTPAEIKNILDEYVFSGKLIDINQKVDKSLIVREPLLKRKVTIKRVINKVESLISKFFEDINA